MRKEKQIEERGMRYRKIVLKIRKQVANAIVLKVKM